MYGRLPATRIPTDVDIVRAKAKKTKNPEVLSELLDQYGYDSILCWNVVTNCKADINVLKCLVNHKDVVIRRVVAEKAELFEQLPPDEKKRLLGKLVFDKDVTVKENLARHTLSEDIKYALYRTPLQMSSNSIRKICIKRIHNMDIVEDFIKKSTGEVLYEFADAILTNKHLTKDIFLQFLKASERLNDEHITLVIHNAFYTEEEFGEYLTKLSR